MSRTQPFDPRDVRHEAFSYNARLERLERFVEKHYSEPLPLRTAARVAGLEETYFSRFFREKTGVRYRDWLSWVRITHAIELLKRRDLSMTETAFSVGFEHLGTFERACKKCTGLTPRAIKKTVRPC
jgi:AraC-like DNA-binding protein